MRQRADYDGQDYDGPTPDAYAPNGEPLYNEPPQGARQQSRTTTSSNQQQSGGNQAPRNPGAPASDKQREYIVSLIDKMGLDPSDVELDDPPITMGEANSAINQLKAGNWPKEWSDPNE